MHIYICSEEHASLDVSGCRIHTSFHGPTSLAKTFLCPRSSSGISIFVLFLIIVAFFFFARGIHMGLGPRSSNNYA